MVGNFRDHGHFGAGARKNDAVDTLHVGSDQFDQRVDGGTTRSFEGDDDGHLSSLYAGRASIETLWLGGKRASAEIF